MMRRALLALSLLTLLPAVVQARGADTLTVVSLNLWHDQHEWPKRLARILRELRTIRPDVICLQEVLQHATLPNQAQTLADSLGYQFTFVSVDSVGRPKRYGNAILTRHPVLAAHERFLKPLDDWRVAAHVRIDFHGRPVDVYDTHLHHTHEGGAIRATQVRDLLDFVATTRGRGALLVAGDFNAPLHTDEMRLLEPAFADAYDTLHPDATTAERATMNPLFEPNPTQIDHVFVERAGNPALVPLACEVLFRQPDADGVWATDHFGVLARLGFATRRGRAAKPR